MCVKVCSASLFQGRMLMAACRAGVYWFSRVTAAAGQDAGAAFRGKLGSLCPELLTGALNHEARNEVGLQRPWCATIPLHF